MKATKSPLLALTLAGIFGAPMTVLAQGGGDVFGYPSAGTCWGQRITINCSAGSLCSGTSGSDVIMGSLGDDEIHAGGGADCICAGSGHDIVYGDAGADFIAGEGDQDDIFGGEGNDHINGGGGNDIVFGDDGIGRDPRPGRRRFVWGDGLQTAYGDGDQISGGAGDDYIRGCGGNDEIYGEGDDDEIYGDSEDDFLDGGSDEDLLFGGPGGDRIRGGSSNDRLLGQDGDDALDGDGGDRRADRRRRRRPAFRRQRRRRPLLRAAAAPTLDVLLGGCVDLRGASTASKAPSDARSALIRAWPRGGRLYSSRPAFFPRLLAAARHGSPTPHRAPTATSGQVTTWLFGVCALLLLLGLQLIEPYFFLRDDNATHFLGAYTYAYEAVVLGRELPLLNQHQFLGNTFLAAGQTGVFLGALYPLAALLRAAGARRPAADRRARHPAPLAGRARHVFPAAPPGYPPRPGFSAGALLVPVCPSACWSPARGSSSAT